MGRKFDPKPRKATIVRYETADGKRCSKETPGAVKRVTVSETYYAQLPHPETRKRTWESLETTDLGAAWQELRKRLRSRALGLDGRERRQALAATTPIADQIEDWLAVVVAGEVTADRVELLRTRMTELARLARWKRITDITRSTCLQALAELRNLPAQSGPSKKYGGRSAQTRNHYLSHARQFSRWLKEDSRLAYDPLEGMQPIGVEADRRHDRRCPSDLEVELFFTFLLGGWEKPPRERKGMSGEQRALAYMVSMSSGLRGEELRSLTWERIDLETGEIHLAAAAAKNRRRTLQPLPRWLLARLQVWKEAGGRLWEEFPAGNPGRLLKADLTQARCLWVDLRDSKEPPIGGKGEEGRKREREEREKSTTLLYEVSSLNGPLYFDFHALRHYYITTLASQPDISPAVLQALSRHSDPKLTLRIYAHARAHATRAAVDRLQLPGASPTTPPPPTP